MFLRAFRLHLNVFLKRTSCSTIRSSSHHVDLAHEVHQPPKTVESTRSPIIILHGLLGTKHNWRSLAKAIAEKNGRTVYVLDARNHGESPDTDEFNYSVMADDVDNFIGKNKFSKTVIIGHSMGGRTAMTLTLRKPELVEKLIIVDVSPKAMPSASTIIQEYMSTMKDILHNLPKGISLPKARRDANNYMASSIPELGLRQFLLTNLAEENGILKWKVNLDSLMMNFSEIRKFPSPAGVFNEPTIFICGADSSYVQKEDEPYIKSLFPKAEFLYIAGAGHFVHSEKPTEFLQAVEKFLN